MSGPFTAFVYGGSAGPGFGAPISNRSFAGYTPGAGISGVVPVAQVLPPCATGVAYSETITAVGGTGPYTFAVVSGALPAGLSLSTAGVISGTPTAAAASSFTVQARDSTGATGSLVFSIGAATGGATSNYGFVS